MSVIKNNSQKFKTVTTNYGRNAVVLAHSSGSSVKLTHMAVGDGKGNPIEPNATMTSLVGEKHRGQINDIIISPEKPGEFTAELLIPQNIGGFFIREVGIFMEDGTLFAIGSTPLTEKTELTSGAASDLIVRMIIRILDAGVIEIVIDPTQVLATRDYVDRSIQKGIDKHNKDENAHKPLFDKIKGLITSAGQSLQTHLTDPNAHKGLFDAIKGQISAIPKISLANIISSTDTAKAVTGKAVSDYAAGKNVENKFTKRNIFEHLGLLVRNPLYEIGQSTLPDKNTYAAIFFIDKRGSIPGTDNSLGHVVNRFTTRGYQETYLDVVKNPNIEGKEKVAYLKVGLSDTDVPYGIAPTVPDDWIGDNIATTAWVKKNAQQVKLLDTRTTLGAFTLTDLIPFKPVYIILGRETELGFAELDVNTYAHSTGGGTAIGANGYILGKHGSINSTDVFIFIPKTTIAEMKVYQINSATLYAYQ